MNPLPGRRTPPLRLALVAALLPLACAAFAGSSRASDATGAWTAFLPSPAARPLLQSLGLPPLTAAQAETFADVMAQAGVGVAEVSALPQVSAQAALVRAKADAYAAEAPAAEFAARPQRAALLAALAPARAPRLEAAAGASARAIEKARRSWARDASENPVAASPQGHAQPRLAPAAPRLSEGDAVLGGLRAPPAPAGAAAPLPFQPTRAIPLSRAAAVMEARLAASLARTEQDYRQADPETLFAGGDTRRMDTLLSRQAADPAQAMLEVVANAQDATTPGGRKVGRFGVGGLQVLGELSKPQDRLVMETSKGDGTQARFVFWRQDSEVYFDYRLAASNRRGTLFRLYKDFTPAQVAHRREFLERKLRANDRGPILWAGGDAINRPQDFRQWGREGPVAQAAAPAVTVAIDGTGYEIEDQGRGMGLKEVFERYLKPYGTDKPVAATGEPARLLYRPAAEPDAALGVAGVEIERDALDSDGRRLNLAGDVFIELPHDTELTEDRGVVSLVTADQSLKAAVRGLRLLIESLTDPSVRSPQRFALINSLAALIRDKQPSREKGLTRGDAATATDLLWYLRQRLARSGLLEDYRKSGAAFLPNAARWAPLAGVSDKIVFLDEALFSPTPVDFANAGFEPLPPSLTRLPAWQALQRRTQAKFFSRPLRPDGALAVVDDGVVVIDQALAESREDPEVLVARIERELSRSAASRAPPPPPGALARLRARAARWLGPAVLAATLAAAPLAYRLAPSWHQPAPQTMTWSTAFHASHDDALGNVAPLIPRPGAKARDGRPRLPFGGFVTDAPVGPFFVSSVKARLDSDGGWSPDDARWAAPASGPIIGSIQVRYRLWLQNGDAERLFNKPDGAIAGVSVEDDRGRPLRTLSFDQTDDSLTVPGYTGPAMVSYRIELHADVNAVQASAPLPANELGDFPQQWRRALDPVKSAPDSAKKAAVERLMAEDFVYDYDQPFVFNGISWSSTAQAYLDSGQRIPIICNTSSLYYYLMARYVGLPAAYVGLENSRGQVFYQNLVGHAKVLVAVDGKWQFVETTTLMPLLHAAPEVISGLDAPRPNPVLRELQHWLRRVRPPLPSEPAPSGPGAWALLAVLLGTIGGSLLLVGRALWRLWRLRRGVSPLRRAWAAFGWRRQRLPLAWLWWRDLARASSFEKRPTPWGAVYRGRGGAYFAQTEAGLRPLPVRGSEPLVRGRCALYVDQNNWKTGGRLRVLDGGRPRTLGSYWHTPKLVAALGPRSYAVIGRSLARLEPESGRVQVVMDLSSASAEIVPIESREGVDRFAVRRSRGLNGSETQTLAVCGDRGRWEVSAMPARLPWSSLALDSAWTIDGRTVYSFVRAVKGERVGGRLLAHGGGPLDLDKRPLAVIGGKLLAAGQGGVEACDARLERWSPAVVDGASVVNVSRLGPDLFFVEGAQDGRRRDFFCDADGAPIAELAGVHPRAAVRDGDTVYYRPYNDDGALRAVSRDSAPKAFALAYGPQVLYSLACAAATGLAPALFEPLDDWEGAGPLMLSRDARELSRALRADGPQLARLSPETRAAAPYRAVMMPRWSLARLFLGVEAARAAIQPETLERLERLARANLHRPDWLRQAFEIPDRLYRGEAGLRTAAAAHYLDLLEAAPEILDDLREALLTPVVVEGGARAQPLAYLSGPAGKALSDLPAAAQVYLQMLREGADSLLRREADDAPRGPAARSVDDVGSLGRLIAAARRVSDGELDAGGLDAFARAVGALGPGEAADLASVRGVVVNQGLSAPVWIRELVQNARDAAREARREGRPVALPDIRLRSFLSEDGSRWLVSVRDGVGMKLGRLIKAMLVPEATTKTLADEVRGFLALGGATEEKLERVLAEFFEEGAVADEALKAFLRQSLAQDDAAASRRIADALSQRMKKGAAGFFGIGFFTVFGGADEVIVRTAAAGGRLREAVLVPVRDQSGALSDIRVERLREYDDAESGRQGTEVVRVKQVSAHNIGRILVENAYVHVMAAKYAGGVSDVGLTLNGESIADGLETVSERAGLRSRLGARSRARWTVDELFVQDPPADGLSLIPGEIRSGLSAAGWNLDFPAATAVVRTRASVQEPARYRFAAAALALPAAYRLYREGRLRLGGLPSYAEYRRISPWDAPLPPAELSRDAADIAAARDDEALWKRYALKPRDWAKLMLAVCDDKEASLRSILGPALCAQLDEARRAGRPLGVGPLPAQDTPGYAEAVRSLHAQALAELKEGARHWEKEPAAAGLSRVLGRLAAFVEDPPAFVATGTGVWEAVRRLLDEGAAVPLMEAFLDAAGCGGDQAAVRLFEGWLRGRGTKKELQDLLLASAGRARLDASLAKLWKAASRGRAPLVAVSRPS